MRLVLAVSSIRATEKGHAPHRGPSPSRGKSNPRSLSLPYSRGEIALNTSDPRMNRLRSKAEGDGVPPRRAQRLGRRAGWGRLVLVYLERPRLRRLTPPMRLVPAAHQKRGVGLGMYSGKPSRPKGGHEGRAAAEKSHSDVARMPGFRRTILRKSLIRQLETSFARPRPQPREKARGAAGLSGW